MSLTQFLPAGLDLTMAGLLIVLSFFTSLITATFSLGGGTLMVAVLALVFPPAVVVPIHGAVQLGSNAGRALVAFFSPADKSAEMFGLFGVATRLAAVLGPLTYGVVAWVSGNNHRLAMLISMHPDSPKPIEPLIGEAVHVVVHIARVEGSRRIQEILEVSGFANGQYITKTL